MPATYTIPIQVPPNTGSYGSPTEYTHPTSLLHDTHSLQVPITINTTTNSLLQSIVPRHLGKIGREWYEFELYEVELTPAGRRERLIRSLDPDERILLTFVSWSFGRYAATPVLLLRPKLDSSAFVKQNTSRIHGELEALQREEHAYNDRTRAKWLELKKTFSRTLMEKEVGFLLGLTDKF